ncbi:MAG: hypothetical protein ACPGLV_06060 [Bacteroidia bacterium]
MSGKTCFIALMLIFALNASHAQNLELVSFKANSGGGNIHIDKILD